MSFKELAKFVEKHKKEYPDLSIDSLERFRGYLGYPMVYKNECEKIDFIIDEYGIEHLLVYLKCILRPAYWQFLRAMIISDIIPNYELYKHNPYPFIRCGMCKTVYIYNENQYCKRCGIGYSKLKGEEREKAYEIHKQYCKKHNIKTFNPETNEWEEIWKK